ncbi:hypothetical protein [Dyella ginsengisoli]|uniref:hypothetical protein n=1 Tax=Dyella ginsengisoli TaxID=363848 RepID=UPI0012FD5257|nr:hypothetical protein [Dyella ginsengisoli]
MQWNDDSRPERAGSFFVPSPSGRSGTPVPGDVTAGAHRRVFGSRFAQGSANYRAMVAAGEGIFRDGWMVVVYLYGAMPVFTGDSGYSDSHK